MKIKFTIIICLFIMLIGFATWESIFIKNSLKDISNLATEIANEIKKDGLNENISKKIDYLDLKWVKTERAFSYLTNHNDMKEIGDSLCYAQTYIEQNNKDGVIEKINLVIYYAESYFKIFSFNIQNII